MEMEPSETVTDYTPKKLAPQKLDFTVPICRTSAENGTPQKQQVHLNLQTQTLPRPLMPPPSQYPTWQKQQVTVAATERIPHPVHKIPAMPPGCMQDSPGSQPVNYGTPNKPKQCNCKHSMCLKLYCECFAAGVYCNGCNCSNCSNNVENDEERKEAVEAILQRNPNAFRPKIASSPHGSQDAREDAKEAQMVGKHNKGCNCKRSGCLKKYCECFQGNIFCSENCKCLACKNFEGSDERRALFHSSPHGTAYTQQATNAAISGAIGLSGYGTSLASKKRKGEELFGVTTKDQSAHSAEKCPQGNTLRNSFASTSPLSARVSRTAKGAVLGSSKPTYRSPLAGVLQPQDVKEICTLLVALSGKTTKALAATGKGDSQSARENSETYSASSVQKKESCQKVCNDQSTILDDHLSGNKAERERTGDSRTPGGDIENARPSSPEIDLMCHEQDMMFMEIRSPNRMAEPCRSETQKSYDGYKCSELYIEQERLILTSFLEVLNMVSTCGSLKVSQSGNQQEPAVRGIVTTRVEVGNHRKEYSNSVAQTPMVAAFVSNGDVPLKVASPVRKEHAERDTIRAGTQMGSHEVYIW